MTGFDIKTALKIAIGNYALNSQISDENSQEAELAQAYAAMPRAYASYAYAC